MELGQGSSHPLAFVAGIFDELQELFVIVLAHGWPILCEFANGSRVPLSSNVVFGHEPLFFRRFWIDGHTLHDNLCETRSGSYGLYV